jgi:two-component sensor histidine kinase
VSNFQEGLQHILKFKKNEPLMQMRFREGLAVAFTNHPLEGSEKIALDLANLAYLTSKTDNDDNLKIELLRQILYLNAIFKNTEKTKKAQEDLNNIIANEKYGSNYNNYLKFGELALTVSQRNTQKTEKLIKEFQSEFYKDSPNILKEQFLHLIYINNKNNSNKGFNSYKKWNKFRDSTRLDFYKNYKDSLQVRYQKASTDKELTRLSNLNELDKAELNFKNKNLYLLLSLLALLVILLFVIFYFNNKLRKQKNLVESLQKEFHHRLKNDFRSINSYIGLVQRQFTNTTFKERLNELKNRVTSMFKVHEILLQEDDITQVKAHPYLLELSKNVEDKYNNKNIKVTCNVDKAEIIVADKAIPFGIVLNEFVTNSYKYAFDDKGGEISIDFKSDTDNHYLTLKDNGKGLPDDFNIENLRSLGMSIIPMFADLYDGSYQLNGSNGVSLTLTLPKKVA